MGFEWIGWSWSGWRKQNKYLAEMTTRPKSYKTNNNCGLLLLLAGTLLVVVQQGSRGCIPNRVEREYIPQVAMITRNQQRLPPCCGTYVSNETVGLGEKRLRWSRLEGKAKTHVSSAGPVPWPAWVL